MADDMATHPHSFTREAINVIERHSPTVGGGGTPSSSPLFIYLAWQNVHGPYEVPSKYRSIYSV